MRRNAETLGTLAWALTRAGRWREARAAIREALCSGVKDPALYRRAAEVEKALGDPEGARFFGGLAQLPIP